MTAPLIAMVLLEHPLIVDQVAAEAVIASFPASAKAKLHAVKKEGTSLQITFDDMKFTVVSVPEPMALRDFAKQFSQPSGRAFEPMIAAHRAKLIITCAHPGEGFGEVVMAATTVHLLARRFGDLGVPLGGYWVSSERLCDWAEFTDYADAVLPAFDNDPETAFPTRYWVSVEMTQDGKRFGGETQGLRPFMGYELDLEPVAWPLAAVAERLVGTVTYLFWHGPVLNDGDTLGVSEDERFRLALDEQKATMNITLESSGT